MTELNFHHAGELFEKVHTELTSPPPGASLPWWPKFTEDTGGLRGKELTVLCAPTGSGKTQLLANIACQLWEDSVPTFVAPVETGDVNFMIRMLSVMERCDWNTGKAYPPERVAPLLQRYQKQIKERPFFLATYNNRVAVEDMDAMLRFQNQANSVQVALLDNLNFFLKISRAADQLLEIDEAVRVIGTVARQTGMHIILICHPKKPEGKDNRVYSEYEIKGSATIVQEADNVLLWNRPDESSPAPNTDRELTIRKMRCRGPLYNRVYRFSYNGGRLMEERI